MTYRDHKMEFIEKWSREKPICINCGAEVSEGWGHHCLFYDCEKCGTFFTDEDVWEIRTSVIRANPQTLKEE